jgi:hypothetical protein
MASAANHATITAAAFDVQSPAFRSAFAAEHQAMIDYYCLYGDLFVHAKGAERKTMARYMTLPDGSCAAMGPRTVDEIAEAAVNRRQFAAWMAALRDCIAAEDVAGAAQFYGVVSHAIGDTSALPHALGELGYDMQLMRRLLPAPSIDRHRSLHNYLENMHTTFDLDGYQPRLRGRTADEAAFFLTDDMGQLINDTLARILPALDAVFRGDTPTAAAAVAAAFRRGAEVLADIMHTGWCLGQNTFADTDIAAFLADPVALTHHIPASCGRWAPWPYIFKPVYSAPVCIDTDLDPVPLAVMAADGTAEPVAAGYGIGLEAQIAYDLPAGVFDRFTTRIGLHPQLPQEMPVELAITLAGADLHRAILSHASTAEDLAFDVSAGGRLQIETAAAIDVDRLANHNCHLVIAAPELHQVR